MTTEDDEKSQTFRKRRLTFPTHQLHATARVAKAVATEFEDDPKSDHEVGDGSEHLQAADDLEVDHQEETFVDFETTLRDENEKSKTFRKRRLTLTAHQVQYAFDSEEGNDFKKRRMSDMSAMSNTSMSTAGSMVIGRIHHAGEILKVPPSPSLANQNRLYAPPHNLERETTKEEKKSQPAWKRRLTRRHSEDETKLPFPRDIVGQYSCHGIEPLYDSEYEHGEEDEEEDEWSDEVPRDGKKNAKNESNDDKKEDVKNDENTTVRAEPKMTTSAKINQDRGGIAFPFGKNKKTALFAVYDGHGQGGELVSQFALHHIQQKLRKHPNFDDDIEKAFHETFLSVDEELKAEPTIEPLYAGTTACVALLNDNVITISNAGDSRAVLARKRKDGSFEAIQLSEDQNPDNPEEQARIESSGGFVSPPPEPGLSARVWLDSECTQIGLAMSRSIGDHAVKGVGVIAEPVVTQHSIKPEDDFLILASDGVWEFISSEEAVEIVAESLPQGASKACQTLIEVAANKWHQEEGDYRDDITALVIRLQHLWDDIS